MWVVLFWIVCITAAFPLQLTNSSIRDLNLTVLEQNNIRWNVVSDPRQPLCEIAAYQNAIDSLVKLSLRPLLAPQPATVFYAPGEPYRRVSIAVSGSLTRRPLVTDVAIRGIYRGIKTMAELNTWYATEASGTEAGSIVGRVLLVPTPHRRILNATFSGNLCGSPSPPIEAPAISRAPTLTANPSITNIEQDPNRVIWWTDPDEPRLHYHCTFGVRTLSRTLAYMVPAALIVSNEFALRSPSDLAPVIDQSRRRFVFKVGGYPDMTRVNPQFTKEWALRAIGRLPRIMYEYQQFKGVIMVVFVDEEPIGVILLDAEAGLGRDNSSVVAVS